MAKKDKANPLYDFPGRHYHEDFDHLVSPVGRNGAETPEYSPDECIDYRVPSNQRRNEPHDPYDASGGRGEGRGGRHERQDIRQGGEYRRNERRGS